MPKKGHTEEQIVAAGAIGILRRLIARVSDAFPKARIRVRLDGGSGFAASEKLRRNPGRDFHQVRGKDLWFSPGSLGHLISGNKFGNKTLPNIVKNRSTARKEMQEKPTT